MSAPILPPVADIGISHSSIVSCLGYGRSEHLTALQDGRSGLTDTHHLDLPFACYVGQVPDLAQVGFPPSFADFDNRTNRLAFAALQTDGFHQAAQDVKQRWGADRCGIVLGTASAGIDALETLYRAGQIPADYSTFHHDNHQSVASFVQTYTGFSGPSYVVSTACSSSAKALIDAYQLIEAGLCDAVLTGGVDCLCLTSLNGFEALELVSRRPCRPCDVARDGLSIGEAAALMIVERDAQGQIRLKGYGETSDGVNMSTPPPDGNGAAMALQQALVRADVAPGDIDYVNLHGTATPVNDSAEARAIEAALYRDVPAASLKGAIGHTLGAAGAAEVVLCLYAMEQGIIPGNTGLDQLDPTLLPNVVADCRFGDLTHVVSNSFGFGGSNCALVLGR